MGHAERARSQKWMEVDRRMDKNPVVEESLVQS